MSDRRAPVQRLSGGIPWDMHLRAYDAYSKKWRPQPAMIEGGCRGGFDIEELDEFIPGWRKELEKRENVKMVRDPRSSVHRPTFILEPAP